MKYEVDDALHDRIAAVLAAVEKTVQFALDEFARLSEMAPKHAGYLAMTEDVGERFLRHVVVPVTTLHSDLLTLALYAANAEMHITAALLRKPE